MRPPSSHGTRSGGSAWAAGRDHGPGGRHGASPTGAQAARTSSAEPRRARATPSPQTGRPTAAPPARLRSSGRAASRCELGGRVRGAGDRGARRGDVALYLVSLAHIVDPVALVHTTEPCQPRPAHTPPSQAARDEPCPPPHALQANLAAVTGADGVALNQLVRAPCPGTGTGGTEVPPPAPLLLTTPSSSPSPAEPGWRRCVPGEPRRHHGRPCPLPLLPLRQGQARVPLGRGGRRPGQPGRRRGRPARALGEAVALA